MPKVRLKSAFLFQTLFCLFFRDEVFELLLPSEQLIAVFQSDECRRALPFIRRHGVERPSNFLSFSGCVAVAWTV